MSNAVAKHTPVDQLPVAPAASESAAILSVIERMALSQDIDPDRVERFMAMYDRMEAQKAQKAFFVAFSAAQAEMPQVVRNAVNDQAPRPRRLNPSPPASIKGAGQREFKPRRLTP